VLGQSVAATHSTQSPAPSQTDPPSSAHAKPDAASVVTQAFEVHVVVAQTVPVGAQSGAVTHATHTPSPSQKLPPWLAQALSTGRFVVPQQPWVHAGRMQSLPAAGQSGVAVHARHASPVPLLDELALAVDCAAPLLLDEVGVAVLPFAAEPPVLDGFALLQPSRSQTLAGANATASAQPVRPIVGATPR
jgi:hypothetical protein